MSSELEQQLRRALARVEPDTTATEQAKAAALAAVSSPSGLRSRYRLALIAAALVGGAGRDRRHAGREPDGAGGGRHCRRRRPRRTLRPHGPLPPGSGGFAAYGGGRLWLASPSLTVAGKPYSAAELSPGALNVAVGSGHALVVRRLSDGGVAWSHPTAGRVRGGRLGADRHRDRVRRQVAPGRSAAHDRGRRRPRPPRRQFGVRGDAVMAGGLAGACLRVGTRAGGRT